MYKYLIQIGNINAQKNYWIIADNSKEAKSKARKAHIESGKTIGENQRIMVAFRKPYKGKEN